MLFPHDSRGNKWNVVFEGQGNRPGFELQLLAEHRGGNSPAVHGVVDRNHDELPVPDRLGDLAHAREVGTAGNQMKFSLEALTDERVPDPVLTGKTDDVAGWEAGMTQTGSDQGKRAEMSGENKCSPSGFLERPEVLFSGESDEFFDLGGPDDRGSSGKNGTFPEKAEGFSENRPCFAGVDSEAPLDRFFPDQTVPPGDPEVAFPYPSSQGHQKPKRKNSDDEEREKEAEVAKEVTDMFSH